MKVLVLGASGMLGSTLSPFLISRRYDVATHSHRTSAQHHADLSNPEDTSRLLHMIGPNCIINLVGLTDVELCEAEPNRAYLVNVRTVENICSWIRGGKVPCHLIHISTDHVYDGGNPCAEDQVRLTNFYAFSKYAGELAAEGVPSTILRTNFFGRSRCGGRASLTDWLFKSLSRGIQIQVFDDVRFSPLALSTVAEMIECCIRNRPIGIFNLGSRNGMSKADFAFEFAEKLGLSTAAMTRSAIDQKGGSLKARRPRDMRTDSTKFEKTIGVSLPNLSSEIDRVVEEYCEER